MCKGLRDSEPCENDYEGGILASKLKVKGLRGLKGNQLMRSTLGATKTLHVVSTLECGENTRA